MGNLIYFAMILHFLFFSEILLMFAAEIDIGTEDNKVLLTFDNQIQNIGVPVAKNPITSSINILKGKFPQMQIIDQNVDIKIGDELSILVSIEDKSNLYDAKVNKCYASTSEYEDYFAFGKEHQDSASKIPKLSNWEKITNPRYNTIVLISHFTAFKFPDAENVFITCDIQLCYKLCKKSFIMN